MVGLLRYKQSLSQSRKSPSSDLFDWTFSTNGSDFATPDSISSRVNIWVPTTENVMTFNHHPYISEKDGVLYVMHSTSDYDEEGVGQWVRLWYSDNNGQTWNYIKDVFPSQSPLGPRLGGVGLVVIPVDFVEWQGELFAVADVNRKETGEGDERFPVGLMAAKINSFDSVEDPVWIHNSDGSTDPPEPWDVTYPQYMYSSETRYKCYNYLDRPGFRPKTNFSDPELSTVRHVHETFGNLSEPTDIRPFGQSHIWKYWKNNNRGLKIGNIDYEDPYFVSSVPDSTKSIVTRLFQYDSNTILISGNANLGNRRMLYLAITKYRSSDGIYETEHVYEIDFDADEEQKFPGIFKGGGPQIVDMHINGNVINFVYSIRKEDIAFKRMVL